MVGNGLQKGVPSGLPSEQLKSRSWGSEHQKLTSYPHRQPLPSLIHLPPLVIVGRVFFCRLVIPIYQEIGGFKGSAKQAAQGRQIGFDGAHIRRPFLEGIWPPEPS